MASNKTPRPQIDCEVCRHYTGTAYIVQFGCARGKCQEKTWTLKREACADFALMPSQEQILKRFAHSAKYYGERDIKKHRGTVRRMATGLQQTLQSFQRFMTLEQTEALKTAARHLAALGDDLELAGRLANQVHQQAEAERQRQEKARRAELVVKHHLNVAPTDCIALAQDLLAFDSRDWREWLCSHKRNPEAFVSIVSITDLNSALFAHNRTSTPATLAILREQIALCIESLQERKHSSSYADWSDFEAFRVWHREVAETIARVAK